jgi:hypothetical protein
MKFARLAWAAAALAITAGPALAHHSYSMFDADKVIDLAGTIKEVNFENPHGWVEFMAIDKAGKVTHWSFEMGGGAGGPMDLSRKGFKAKNVAPGDKLVARIHPLRSGMYGGELISLIFPDGSQLGGKEPIPRGDSTSTSRSAQPIN